MSEPTDLPNVPAVVEGEQTHLRLPSRPDWIEAAVDYLKHKAILCGACEETRAGKLLIALHEAICNAVIHGNLEVSSELKERGDDDFGRALAARAADPVYAARAVEIFVDCNRARCQWAITDQGPGFNVEATLLRVTSDDPEVLLASGRGILMMRSFMDDVAFEAGGRRVILTLNRSSGEEKRQQDRVGVNTPLRVAPIRADGTVDWDAACKAVSRDLSSEGISFWQSHLAASEHIMIALDVDGRPVYLPAEVRHCRTLEGDMVEIGCRFRPQAETASASAAEERSAVAEAIDKLLAQVRGQQPQSHERRRHTRVGYADRIEVSTGPGCPLTVGYPRDLSRSGIAFITSGPLPRDITLIFPAKGSEAPLQVRAEVVRCARVHDDFYDVGAQLVELAEAAASDQP